MFYADWHLLMFSPKIRRQTNNSKNNSKAHDMFGYMQSTFQERHRRVKD